MRHFAFYLASTLDCQLAPMREAAPLGAEEWFPPWCRVVCNFRHAYRTDRIRNWPILTTQNLNLPLFRLLGRHRCAVRLFPGATRDARPGSIRSSRCGMIELTARPTASRLVGDRYATPVRIARHSTQELWSSAHRSYQEWLSQSMVYEGSKSCPITPV